VSPFTRDDHLSDLGLELLDADELSSDDQAAAEAHLAQCATCRERLEAFGGVAPLTPRAAPLAPANRPWAWAVLAASVAAAVLVAVGLSTGPLGGEQPGDGIRLKGRGLSLQVVRATDDGTAEPLASRAAIHPGDRLGFVVSSTTDGQLMVLAADPRGQVDVCYPQGQSTSAPLQAGPARSLPDAVRADDVLGEARFVALRCDHGFSASEARQIVQGAAPPAGCVSEEVVLDKVPR